MSQPDNNDYKKLFTHAAVGMARVSPQGYWLEVNERLCEIVGYSEADLLNSSCQNIIHPHDIESLTLAQ